MTARVFISYRSSDGADKATALAAALAAGAHVVPLICDGIDALPDAVMLPPPFDQLADRTWRRLRAYDWKDDMVWRAEARFWINSEQAERAVVLRRER